MSGKLIDFNILRINRAARKFCRCPNPHYELDTVNRVVTCTDCGAFVDPIEALRVLSHEIEQFERIAEYAVEERKKLDAYKPRLKVIKFLEEQYTGTRYSLIPSCPVCGEFFDLAELTNVTWREKEYHNAVIAAKKEGK